MKKITALFLICLFCLSTASGQVALKPQVSENAELMAILARLAGYDEFQDFNSRRFVQNVDNHFEPYKNHEAVQFMRKMRGSNGISYNAVGAMGVFLTPPPELLPVTKFTRDQPEERWTPAKSRQFVKLLRDFYQAAECEKFFADNRALLDTIRGQFEPLVATLDAQWFEKFYNTPRYDFNPTVCFLTGPRNYASYVTFPDGSRKIYALMGSYAADDNDKVTIDDNYFTTLVHEFSHAYVNPRLALHRKQLRSAAEAIHAVQKDVISAAYSSHNVICESMVRAAEVLYAKAHGRPYKQGLYNDVNYNGFIWLPQLIDLLETEYMPSRAQYADFDAFIPRLIEFCDSLAPRMADMRAAAESAKPHVVSIQPFANGDQAVDPALTHFSVTFDKPLVGVGVSLGYGPKGAQAFPEKLAQQYHYSENNTVFNCTMALKPDTEYQFRLLGMAFRTPDGHPLDTYLVTLRTAKQ